MAVSKTTGINLVIFNFIFYLQPTFNERQTLFA